MKFIADAMLGRLAKRMRLFGLDVAYDRNYEDNEVLRLSLEQDRIILTRDTGLARRPLATRHFLITHDRVQDQLDQVFSAFRLEHSTLPLSRCSRCNVPLEAVDKRDVRQLIPDYIYQKHDRFLECGKCGRVYWMGTHVREMGFYSEKKRAGR